MVGDMLNRPQGWSIGESTNFKLYKRPDVHVRSSIMYIKLPLLWLQLE
jgi:hypothetical protein